MAYAAKFPFILLGHPLLLAGRRLDEELLVGVQNDVVIGGGLLFDVARSHDGNAGGQQRGR